MELTTWLEKKKMKAGWFARMCGVDETLVSRWLAGIRNPTPAQVKTVEKYTNGDVTLADWARAERRREPS